MKKNPPRLARSALPFPSRRLRTGIVHIGLGAFHRAHQAVYTADAMQSEQAEDWGICGVTQRSDEVLRRLNPQDNLYTLVERGAGANPMRVLDQISETVSGRDDPAAVIAAIARPEVHIVSLTVTEKGYRHDPATGLLDLTDPEIAADLAGRLPRTTIGQLVAGLVERRTPLTVLCCDNLPENGEFLRGLVHDFADAADVRLHEDLTFPSSMVDRIVPATTEADRARVLAASGYRDEAVVVTEPFRQWVIEDNFAGPRPAWHRVGVQFTDDIRPWETLKLRVLNASHSLLAYLGLLVGHELIAQAVADPLLRAACTALVEQDVRPVLDAPPEVDVAAYAESVLARFANPALPHTTAQVATDGSQKLGPRLLATATEARARGRDPRFVALAVAAWLHHVLRAEPLVDPRADTLRAAARDGDPVGALLDLVLPEALRGDRGFVDAVRATFAGLAESGPYPVIRALLTS